jgi:glucosyl-3-phosphoglycerate synthase
MKSADSLIWPGEQARSWFQGHTLGARHVPPAARIAARKRAEGLTVSVALPALNEGTTVGTIVDIIQRELSTDGVGLIDELVVLDGGSSDDTAMVAEAAGATVVRIPEVLPEIALVPGKGESLWRSLAVLRGDIVVWIDADIRNFNSHFVSNLVAPLVMNPELQFVKGYYDRPLERDGQLHAGEGGRVTELLARPLLGTMFPELSGFIQPLSGEYAGRREILEEVPFFTGYSVEVGLLIDLLQLVGLDALAQVDLGERVHRNRPLEELSPMAYTIARAILQRAEARGRMESIVTFEDSPFLMPGGNEILQSRQIEEVERPPMRLLPTYLAALRRRGEPLTPPIVEVL